MTANNEPARDIDAELRAALQARDVERLIQLLGDEAATLSSDAELVGEARELILLLQLISYRRRGEFTFATQVGERLRAVLSASARRSPGIEVDRLPVSYIHLALTSMLAGSTAHALADLALATQATDPVTTSPAVRQAIDAMTGLAHALRGSAHHTASAPEDGAVPDVDETLGLDHLHLSRAARELVVTDAMTDLQSVPRVLGAAELTSELWPVSMLVQGRRALALHMPAVALELVDLATTAQPTEAGSLAADVAAAVSIDAFVSLGELAGAAAVIAQLAHETTLARVARARYLLHVGEIDAAARLCRVVLADETSPLSVRGEILLLSLWIEFRTHGRVDTAAANGVAHLATGSGMRRLFTTVPESLIVAIAGTLPRGVREQFAAALADLRFEPELTPRPRLSDREATVLAAIIEHGTVTATAAALFVSANTVKSQLAAIYRKLGVSTREEAVIVARRLDLTEPPDDDPR